MKIGKANYSQNSSSKRKIVKIENGDNIYRILPPLGSMADKGRWSRYMRIEWGYKNSKGQNRPFQDVRVVNRKSKMVEVESAAHLFREAIKSKLDETVQLFKLGKATDAEVKAMKEKSLQYNLEAKHFVNAITPTGEIVLLKIGHRAKLALDAAIRELEAQGVDPLSVDNGRFFNIRRSGNALDTTFNISIVKENIKTEQYGILQRDIVHALDEATIARLSTEATDLGELDKLYPVLSAEQVEKIVKGGPAAVDEVLGVRGDSELVDDGGDDEGVTSATVSAPVATSAVATPAPEVKAEPAQAPQQEVTPSVSTQAPAGTQKKEDFLKSLGL